MRLAPIVVVCVLAANAGAVPPHHTRDGFRNLAYTPHAGPDVTLPFFVRRVWTTISGRSGMPGLVENDGAFLRENAGHSVPTATWIGHSTVLVQMDGVTFLTDPIWSERASPFSFAGPKRFAPPGVQLDLLPPIDFVVVSHAHYDHADVPTLVALARRGPTRFFVPSKLGALLREAGIEAVEELDWWDSRQIGRVVVQAVPAQHWSARGLLDRDRTLWAGWVVGGPTRRFYFAGDTGYFAGFGEIGSRLGPFGLVALPIGAYEPAAMMQWMHMNPEEAIRAAIDMRATRTLGVHYGTFDLTDEPPDEPPRRFHAAAAAAGLPPDDIWTLQIGETRQW